MRLAYAFLWCIAWPFVNLFHPVKAFGRAHIPEGAVLVAGNHTAMSDPFLVVYAAGLHFQMRPMAKAELLRIPLVGWLLRKAGVFGVERGKADIGAIKQAIKYLKGGEKVLMFPEGHRIQGGVDKEGHEGEAKTGAAMLAVRTGVQLLPVYVPEKKRWFRRTPVVFGEPYYPQVDGDKKPGPEEYRVIAEDLMRRIHALGESVGT